MFSSHRSVKRQTMDTPLDGPDVKRRRTDDCLDSFPSDDWGNDDFSQAELENIDTIIATQQPSDETEQNNNGEEKPSTSGTRTRVVGKGHIKSHSANEVLASPSANLQPRQNNATKLHKSSLNSRRFPLQQSSNQSHARPMQSPAPGSSAPGHSSSPAGPQSAAQSHSLEAKVAAMKAEIEKFRSAQYSAEGKVKILQLNLLKKESEINKLRQENVSHDEQLSKDRQDKEKQYQREVEKLKTELQFKEQEVLELQRNLKSERLNHMGPGGEARSPVLRSPPAARRRIQSPGGTPKGKFPTKQTFLSDERSPKKTRDETTQSSTSTLTAPETVAHGGKHRKMKLQGRMAAGLTSGPQLASKLLEGSSGASVPSSPDGLLRLMQKRVLQPQQPKEELMLMPRKSVPVQPAESSPSKEHQSLALQALTTLLDSPTLGHSDCVLLFLPLIESHISRYVDSVRNPVLLCQQQQQQNKDTTIAMVSSAASHVVNTSSSTENSSSFASLASVFEGALMADLHACALEALQKLLYLLVEYSVEVRRALLAMAGGGAGENIDSGGDSSSSQKERRRASCDSRSSRSTTPIPATCRSHLIQESQLFSLLTILADPHHVQGVMWPVALTTASLSVLTKLALMLEHNHLHIFECLLSPNGAAIANCLEEVSVEKLSLLSAVIDLLTAIVKAEKILKLLCTNSGDCILLSVYHCCINIPSSCSQEQRIALKQKLLVLLSAIVSHYGAEVLLNGCDCSQEVVKCIVLMLHSELPESCAKSSSVSSSTSSPPSSSSTAQSSSSQSASTTSLIPGGLRLLHALCVGGGDDSRGYRRRHADDTEHHYVQVLFSYADMINSHRNVAAADDDEYAAAHTGENTAAANATENAEEHECLLTLLSDLWDFDHALPWEDLEEEEEEMEES